MNYEKTCCILLDEEPYEMHPPPYGRYIERIIATGRVDLAKGGPFGMQEYFRLVYERIPGRPWAWRLKEKIDVSEHMYLARLRLLASAISE